jgi:hypothetical protein
MRMHSYVFAVIASAVSARVIETSAGALPAHAVRPNYLESQSINDG